MKKKNLALMIIMIFILIIFPGCNGINLDAINSPPKDLEETPASEFEYRTITDGIEITKYTGIAIKVRIPQKIENISVISIEERAFYDSEITEVYIPSSVTNIENLLFANDAEVKIVIINGITASIIIFVFAAIIIAAVICIRVAISVILLPVIGIIFLVSIFKRKNSIRHPVN